MRLLLCALTIAGLAVVAQIAPARAEVPDPGSNTVTVSSPGASGTAGYSPQGTQAHASSSSGQPGSSRPAASGSGGQAGAGGGVIPAAQGICSGGGQPTNLTYGPGGQVTGATCPGSVSRAGGGGPAVTVSPIQLAQQASAAQPWPKLTVEINPGNGLTGLPSWFWVGGNPSIPDATASAGSLTVTVRAVLTSVGWTFGDGGTAAGIGRPYPAESNVQHTYQTDSSGRPKGYDVVVTVRYHVLYSTNGGPFAELGFRSNGYARSYTVDQLQPQAVIG